MGDKTANSQRMSTSASQRLGAFAHVQTSDVQQLTIFTLNAPRKRHLTTQTLQTLSSTYKCLVLHSHGTKEEAVLVRAVARSQVVEVEDPDLEHGEVGTDAEVGNGDDGGQL